MNRSLLALLAPLALAACGPSHIAGYTPKHRDYPVASSATGPAQASPGSLWREGSSAASLYTDARALHENDLVVVRVSEMADAKRATDTDISRQSSTNGQVNAFLGALSKSLPKTIDGNSLTTFKGTGSTARSEYLTATVPAIVRKVLPNGNLFIEGHRVILVNQEEQHFYISGVVRPIDIDQENSIRSAQIADAEIEFTGRGVLSDNQHQGWISRYFGWIWPF